MPVTRRLMCDDCAYRPGSPEKSGDPMYRGDATDLEMIAETGTFFCHQGLRRIVSVTSALPATTGSDGECRTKVMQDCPI